MASDMYPTLGFNPCPGSPDNVSTLAGRLSSASKSMQQANELMARVRNADGSAWQGEAGQAFRSHIDATLVADLEKGNRALNKAFDVMRRWETSLKSYWDRAHELERQAAEVQKRLDAAEANAKRLAKNPDHHWGIDPSTLTPEMLNRQHTAQLELRRANDECHSVEDELERIRKKAKDLQEEYEDESNKAAGQLKDAAEFAPQKPGLLKRLGQGFVHAVKAFGDWVNDHLDEIHSVLSTISAVAGLVALCTPPPIDVVAGAIAVGAGAGALAVDFVDPKFRHQMGRLLTGHFDKDSLGAGMTLVGDAVSVIPGAELASKVVSEGVTAAPKVVELASQIVKEPGLPAKLISKVPGVEQAVTWGASKVGVAGGAQLTEKVVEFGVQAQGVGSSLSDLKKDLWK